MNQKPEIQTWRKVLYYLGFIVMAVGFMLFFSVFLTFFNTPSFGFSNMIRAPFGIILIIIGQIMTQVGRAGLAGSGVILDPEKAREDLKPYSRQVGGMVGDALEVIEEENPLRSKEVIKVRCRYCDELNDEDAKYCKNCGKEL